MIVIVRKNNIVLALLILLLCVTILSFNVGANKAAPVVGEPNSQKTVLLDPGHGGEDPGAVSDYNGIREKDINLNIALAVKSLLEQENYRVLMTRQEDRLEYQEGTTNIVQKRKQDLTRRKQMMDDGGANIVVSIHLNKFPQTQYHGAQTFFVPSSSEGQKLAMSLQKTLRDMVDPQNTREALAKKEEIIILKNSKTTTAIVECGFLSNQEEENRLGDKEYQQKLAVAITNGIKAYFNGKN